MANALSRCVGLLLLICLLAATGCALPSQGGLSSQPEAALLTPNEAPAGEQPKATQAPAQAGGSTMMPLASPTLMPQPAIYTPMQSATSAVQIASAACAESQCIYDSPLWLAPPIQPPHNDRVDASYRFGSTQEKQRDPHHGVEFLNPYGTPVLAAGDGQVIVVGDDKETLYSLYPNYYGNLVVIQHDLPTGSQGGFQPFPGGDLPTPIYSLYAHLSEISVKAGQHVQAGQEIGRVGMSGGATGSHLHFEVRLGENTYQGSHNPELWLAPHTDQSGVQGGALAGRVLDAQGQPIQVKGVVIQYLADDPQGPVQSEIYLNSYEEAALLGRSPWGESFAVGDMATGWYRVNFPYNGMQRQLVQVMPGQITVVTFQF
jgi:murein DD-endopeptidase MepM/ murein hydrolase activator NlpD